VAQERPPSAACEDAHLPEHVFTWKTLLSCEQTETAAATHAA